MGNLLLDLVFTVVIVFIAGLTITGLWKAVRAGYRRAMIETIQNMGTSGLVTKNPAIYGLDAVELEKMKQTKPEQKPHIGMYTVHMLAPNVAQYGKDKAVYIPTVAGIPASALPNLSFKDPWQLSKVMAAQVPEVEECGRSATGLFYECGVPAANSLCK